MSRKRKNKQAVPEEILAEGSEGTPVHVQADEAGTELHVTADEVDVAEVVEVIEPRAKQRKARKAAPVIVAAGDGDGEALADVGSDATELAAAAPDALATDSDVLAADGDDPAMAGAELAGDAEVLAADGDALAADSEGADGASADAEVAADGEEIAAVMPTSAASLDPKTLKHLVEALVFAADKPITVQRLRQLTRVADVGRLEAALAELAIDYQDRGVILQQVSGGYQFRTQTRFSAWVQQLIQGRPVRLSRAQLETLAIVAYRQPITRPEIDDIRGVDSSATLKLLLDRALIRILGKREEVGRPMLYGTTKEFLDFFSLGDLRELPTLREYSELTDESRKVMKDRLGGGEPEGGSTPSSDDDGGAPPADDGGGAPPSDGDAHAAGDEGAADVAADGVEGDASEREAMRAGDHVDASDTTSEHLASATEDAANAASADATDVVAAHADTTSEGGIASERDEVRAHVGVDAEDAAALGLAEDQDGLVGEVGAQGDADGQAWPQGSMRMAAVTPPIELEPKPEEPVVDAHVVPVLEGVAPDSGGPIQE